MTKAARTPRYSIRDLSRMSGFTSDRIRAWELRHALFSPRRRPSGYRDYGPDDLRVLLAAKRLLEEGKTIGEIAALGRTALAKRGEGGAVRSAAGSLAARLHTAIDALGRGDMNSVATSIQGASELAGVERFYDEFARPLLAQAGDLWALGKLPIWLEHFVTRLVRQRLEALWTAETSGSGPVAILFCPEGEFHELPLVALAVKVRAAGFCPVILGAHLPVREAALAAEHHRAALAVTSVTHLGTPAAARALADDLAELGRNVTVIVGGRGAQRYRTEFEALAVTVAAFEELAPLLARLRRAGKPAPKRGVPARTGRAPQRARSRKG